MNRKNRTHRLPKFPDTVAPAFRSLCEVLTEEEAHALKVQVDHCMEIFEEQAKSNSIMNIELARKIGDRCHSLLDLYDEADDAQRRLIMGAVRYFAIAEDPLAEESFATGFDDDAKVMNYVLEELGLDDFYIEIRHN